MSAKKNEMDFTALAAPFDPARVHWRVGSTTQDKARGMALAYIDPRDVMDRLDSVCGPGNWMDEYVANPKGEVKCRLSIKIDGEWVAKEDGAEATDIEAVKGGYSDAFKRAAVKWGIGRYLYRLDSPWVSLEGGKRIAQHEFARLADLLSGEKDKPSTAKSTVAKSSPSAGKGTADSPSPIPTADQPEPAPGNPDKPSDEAIALRESLKECGSKEQLEKWWDQNLDAVNKLSPREIDWLEKVAVKLEEQWETA